MKKYTWSNRRFSLLHLTAAVVVTLLLTLAGVALAAWTVLGPGGLTLLEGLGLIRTSFVGEYEESDVIDNAMAGMIAGTGDRWSYYLSPESYQAEMEHRANAYVGIGVTVDYSREEGLSIVGVTAGGPAEEAGLQPGELITAVDGVSAAGEDREEAMDLIQGEEGTTVVLTVQDEAGTEREVTVERRNIESDPVSYEMLEGDVGYVQISNFFSRSADGLKAAVDDLQSRGARALVFDVRNNGGGYLDELTAMLDYLLDEGPILQTRSHTGAEEVVESDAACVDLPMAVLVNADTYSAAEIFAGELQERGVGVIVGVPTSGKGYSQQTFLLPNGGAVGLSTAAYFTGEGVSLIGTGLTLDREVALTEEQAAQLAAGTLEHGEDPQLQAALELLQEGA
ncbi:MAG TPA: S41 family peptidase [Candidatus Flavonifractor intestinipullorum]|uniref:S41 family peptidase n=1 Tax=Candidatus Flavonifractor intestinipullorum TaxID=2838587 RepID=A0A9D2M9E1_9FIRM|nr:S41 family peptidase [Candidatus Flavonifractor intestinipullorum]